MAGMTAFVEDYLGAVTDDPGTTWERLTPAFQEKSSGFDSYRDFWNRIDTATPSRIVADPAQMQVSYVVDYVLKRSNERQRDEVTLLLEYDGGRYRIADETS